jgi:hypothetical protein
MAITVSRSDVWTGTLEDRPGGLAEKLEALAQAGANLEYVLARRTPEQPGQGVLFVAPVKGAKLMKAARAAGLDKAPDIQAVRIEGGDKPGLGAKIARGLADAGLSFRGLTAVATGRKFVSYVAFDSAEDAVRAASQLKKLKI